MSSLNYDDEIYENLMRSGVDHDIAMLFAVAAVRFPNADVSVSRALYYQALRNAGRSVSSDLRALFIRVGLPEIPFCHGALYAESYIRSNAPGAVIYADGYLFTVVDDHLLLFKPIGSNGSTRYSLSWMAYIFARGSDTGVAE